MTKDKIRLYSLHFCRRACSLFSNLICESVAVIRPFWVSSFYKTCSKMRDFSLEFIFSGVCTEKSQCFAIDKAFFDPWEMRILKCFSTFQMRFYI